MIREAAHEDKIFGYTFIDQIKDALNKKIITVEQFDIVMRAIEARKKVIAVDDFLTEDLAKVFVKESTYDFKESSKTGSE